MTRVVRAGAGWVVVFTLLLAAGLLVAGPSAAAPKGSADLQWAQEVLREKGFDPGRPDGAMSERTRAALQAFQRASGLPASGSLDQATIARLMAGRPAPSSVGTLGATPASPGLPPSPPPPPTNATDGNEHPLAPHHPRPAPAATAPAHAPTPLPRPAPIASSGEHRITPLVSAGSTPPAARPVPAPVPAPPTPTSSSSAPAPKAAPSGNVVTQAAPLLPGQPSAPGQAATADDPIEIAAPGWVRQAVIGVIAAIFSGFALLWWLSGRPGRLRAGVSLSQSRNPSRVEPRLGGAPSDDNVLRGRRLG